MSATMIRTGVAGVAIGFLAGCAHQVPATPNTAAIATPAHKVPLSVGFYFSEAFLGFQHSESKWGDGWNFINLGQASANQFREALERNYVTVVKLNGKPGKAESDAKALDLMIAPEIQGYAFDIPLTKFQVYPATITYKINVYQGDTLSASPIVSGVGDTAGSPGFDFSTNPSNSASKAIEDGVNKAMAVLATTPVVQSLAQKKAP
ncbi:MAG: hypothetical protein LDL19_05215 [Thiobacillus sp.]|nr:hypothetical protein [Thiobacillus sp.]